ncbi:hypothetical protein Barb6XT_01915 [Bacteroidales bacterium Barb6XT]|nr:hypothetical protein Barb6XT_01915 [Bacteroidales bacterium Barb6XT]
MKDLESWTKGSLTDNLAVKKMNTLAGRNREFDILDTLPEGTRDFSPIWSAAECGVYGI